LIGGRNTLQGQCAMDSPSSFQASERDRFAGATLVMLWITNTLVFLILFLASRFVVLSEIRNHALGVAAAVASGLSGTDLMAIRGPADQDTDLYRNLQHQLDQAVRFNPDIRFLYTMRRSTQPFAPSTAFEYVVDQQARDRNRDGVIGEDERCEPPGQPYDASGYPAMQEAWQRPSADPDISPDPPYPDMISGYAPVPGPDGHTVAIVGADVTASTVHQKMRLLLMTMLLLWAIMGTLGHVVVHLYHGQRESRERARQRNSELAAKNELLRRTLARHSTLHPTASNEPRLVSDLMDVEIASAGGGDFRTFDLDHDRIAFLLAELSPDPAAAALTTVAMDMLIERVTPRHAGVIPAMPYVDTSRPAEVVSALLRLLSETRPVASRVMLIYGVMDFSSGRMSCALAGCPPPMIWTARGEVRTMTLDPVAREVMAGTEAVAEGDLVLIAGPGREPTLEWQDRVRSWVASAPDRHPLAGLAVLNGRPAALFLLK